MSRSHSDGSLVEFVSSRPIQDEWSIDGAVIEEGDAPFFRYIGRFTQRCSSIG